MKLSVRGKNEKLSKAEVRYASNFFMNLLFKDKPKIVPELDVIVQFIDLGDTKGFCYSEDDVDKNPRIFTVEIDPSLSRKQQLLTLAHEYVHIKQYATNEMYDEDHQMVRWRKKLVNTEEIDYWDQEFEIEAWGRQEGLYQRYIQHLKESKIKFLKPQKKLALVQRADLQ